MLSHYSLGLLYLTFASNNLVREKISAKVCGRTVVLTTDLTIAYPIHYRPRNADRFHTKTILLLLFLIHFRMGLVIFAFIIGKF